MWHTPFCIVSVQVPAPVGFGEEVVAVRAVQNRLRTAILQFIARGDGGQPSQVSIVGRLGGWRDISVTQHSTAALFFRPRLTPALVSHFSLCVWSEGEPDLGANPSSIISEFPKQEIPQVMPTPQICY